MILVKTDILYQGSYQDVGLIISKINSESIKNYNKGKPLSLYQRILSSIKGDWKEPSWMAAFSMIPNIKENSLNLRYYVTKPKFVETAKDYVNFIHQKLLNPSILTELQLDSTNELKIISVTKPEISEIKEL
jgi:hypothetical protein